MVKRVLIKESWDDVTYLHHPDYESNPTEDSYGNKVYTKPDTEAKAAWQKLANNFHKKDVYVAVSPHVMNKVIEDGRLKNQHETNTSNGTLNPEYRKRFEDEYFKDKLPSLKDKPYPIYGYVSSHPRLNRVNGHVDTVNVYGNIRLKIKPHLRQDTTFTRKDSLGADVGRITPSHLTHPHWKSLAPYQLSGIPEDDSVRAFSQPNNEIDASDMNYSYHEAQIHNQVHLHDIDSIHVFPHSENRKVDFDKITRDHGIPVHYYNSEGEKVEKNSPGYDAHFKPDYDSFHELDDYDSMYDDEERMGKQMFKDPTLKRTNYIKVLGDEIKY